LELFNMSVTFSIKGVPEAVAERLRERALRHHRSLQGELLAIIEAAAHAAPAASAGVSNVVVDIDRRGHPVVRKGVRRIEEVAAELLSRTPVPRAGLPNAVDIVRQSRDTR
jgi:plasmid stability protein